MHVESHLPSLSAPPQWHTYIINRYASSINTTHNVESPSRKRNSLLNVTFRSFTTRLSSLGKKYSRTNHEGASRL